MTGTTKAKAPEAADALQELMDERDIIGLTVAYCWTLDGRQFEDLGTIFTEDATADYGEGLGVFNGVAEIAEICRHALGPLDASAHSVTNHQVEVNGDTARCRCYFQAQHVRLAAEGGPNLIIAGKYTDQLVRTAKGWRIKHRELASVWMEGNREVLVL